LSFFSSFAWAAGRFAIVTLGLFWHIPIFKEVHLVWWRHVLVFDNTNGNSYRVPELDDIKNNKRTTKINKNQQINSGNTNFECYTLNTSCKLYTSLNWRWSLGMWNACYKLRQNPRVRWRASNVITLITSNSLATFFSESRVLFFYRRKWDT